jgi:hypothetical protein
MRRTEMQAVRPPRKPAVRIKRKVKPVGMASFTKKVLKSGHLTPQKKDGK